VIELPKQKRPANATRLTASFLQTLVSGWNRQDLELAELSSASRKRDYRNSVYLLFSWIPVYTGMTTKDNVIPENAKHLSGIQGI